MDRQCLAWRAGEAVQEACDEQDTHEHGPARGTLERHGTTSAPVAFRQSLVRHPKSPPLVSLGLYQILTFLPVTIAVVKMLRNRDAEAESAVETANQ